MGEIFPSETSEKLNNLKGYRIEKKWQGNKNVNVRKIKKVLKIKTGIYERIENKGWGLDESLTELRVACLSRAECQKEFCHS